MHKEDQQQRLPSGRMPFARVHVWLGGQLPATDHMRYAMHNLGSETLGCKSPQQRLKFQTFQCTDF